jgi:hypothetical protein
MSAFAAAGSYDRPKSGTDPRTTVQHSVLIRNSDNLRKLNELLAAGWRVIHTAPFEPGAVMLVIEAEGDPEAVAEFRQVFGATAGSA